MMAVDGTAETSGFAENIGLRLNTVSYTHLDVYKRQVLRYRQQRSSFLLKLLPRLFSRSQMFSAKPDVSAVPSTCLLYTSRCV